MTAPRKFEILLLGGSAGSLSMVIKILQLLTVEMNLSVIVILHRKQSDDSTLVELLSSRTSFAVKEADDKDEIQPGVVYIAPADYHVLIEKDKSLSLDTSEKVNFSRPSIDVTFQSAAEVYGEAMICALLSGANFDGVEGLISASQAGSFIVVQDPKDAEFPMMPQQAVAKVAVNLLVDGNNLAQLTSLFV